MAEFTAGHHRDDVVTIACIDVRDDHKLLYPKVESRPPLPTLVGVIGEMFPVVLELM